MINLYDQKAGLVRGLPFLLEKKVLLGYIIKVLRRS